MISDNEFLEIIQGLHEKTANENLKWQRKPPGFVNPKGQAGYSLPRNEAFWVQLPRSVIELEYGSPPTEPDFINFALARTLDGDALTSRKVYEGDVGWDQLDELYALIKRRDLGWDDVLKDVREFLGTKKVPAAS